MLPITDSPDPEAGQVGVALLPLLTGVVLMLVMTVLPGLATDSHGQADHLAALLIFWAMSSGFVRGVGFIPQHTLPRLFFSGPTCALALSLAFSRIAWLSHLPWPL